MSSILVVGDMGTRDPGTASLLQALTSAMDGRRPVLTSTEPATTGARTGLTAVDACDGAAVWDAMRAADGVVLVNGALRGGSGTLRWRDRRSAALRLCLAARALGKPVALFTVVAGGLHRPAERLRARTLVRCADLVVLRDRTSADALAEAGAPTPLRIGADPSWAALAPLRADAPPVADAERTELVAVLNATRTTPAGREQLATALRRVGGARGLRVRLVPWRLARRGGDDLDLARTIGARIPGSIVDVPPSNLGQMRALAAGAAVVVTGRLHAMHAAASAGTPVLAVTAREDERLLALELGQRVVRPGAGADLLTARLDAALDGPPPHADIVDRHEEAAERSLRLLRLLLARGASDDDLQSIALPLAPTPEVIR